jgi:cytochrome c oxidase subunit 2
MRFKMTQLSKKIAALAALCTITYAANATPLLAAQAVSLTTIFLYIAAFALMAGVLLMTLRLLNNVYKTKGQRLLNWNAVNGGLFLVFGVLFFAYVFWQTWHYGGIAMTTAGSAHAAVVDELFMVTFYITFFVFIATHVLLFWFSYKYRARKGHTALYYPDNHTLEFVWTVIPGVVLLALVVYGLKVWSAITQHPPQGAKVNTVELYAYQFGWKARYAGTDNQLGAHNYKLIAGTNDMGVDDKDPKSKDDFKADMIYLPVNEPVMFRLRAQDVIHSAYIPDFRMQMNVVPGMPTQFYVTPIYTTDQMRQMRNNYDFDYLLFCNKICGSAHFNMKRVIKVVTRPEYEQWLLTQKPYFNQVPKPQTASIN